MMEGEIFRIIQFNRFNKKNCAVYFIFSGEKLCSGPGYPSPLWAMKNGPREEILYVVGFFVFSFYFFILNSLIFSHAYLGNCSARPGSRQRRLFMCR